MQLNNWMRSLWVNATLVHTGLHVGQLFSQKVCCYAQPCLHWGCLKFLFRSNPPPLFSLLCLSTTQCQGHAREFGLRTWQYSICDSDMKQFSVWKDVIGLRNILECKEIKAGFYTLKSQVSQTSLNLNPRNRVCVCMCVQKGGCVCVYVCGKVGTVGVCGWLVLCSAFHPVWLVCLSQISAFGSSK